MAKTKRKSRLAETSPKPRRDTVTSRENGRLVAWGFLSVVLSVVVSFQPLSPLVITAPVVRPFLRRMQAGKQAEAANAMLRWAITIFLTILLCSVFATDRVLSSFPFAGGTAEIAEQLIAGSGSAPAGLLYIVAGLIAFTGLAAASLGVGACLLASVALGAAAGTAITLYAHGNNLLLITIAALPPWQWAMFASALLLVAPAAAFGANRLFRKSWETPALPLLKRRVLIAGGLFLLALLLRLVLAGSWQTVIRAWTVT